MREQQAAAAHQRKQTNWTVSTSCWGFNNKWLVERCGFCWQHGWSLAPTLSRWYKDEFNYRLGGRPDRPRLWPGQSCGRSAFTRLLISAAAPEKLCCFKNRQEETWPWGGSCPAGPSQTKSWSQGLNTPKSFKYKQTYSEELRVHHKRSPSVSVDDQELKTQTSLSSQTLHHKPAAVSEVRPPLPPGLKACTHEEIGSSLRPQRGNDHN